MKKYLYIGLALLLSSCANYHLNRSEFHLKKAIAKGAKVEKDTLTKEVPVFIFVGGDSLSKAVNPEIDNKAFKKVIDKNDSLVLEIERLKKSGSEKDLIKLEKANKEILVLKKRLAQGFQKDSTYVFKPDSITEISVSSKDGLINLLSYNRKETTYKGKQEVPVAVINNIKPKNHYFEWFVGGIILGIILVLVVWYYSKRAK